VGGFGELSEDWVSGRWVRRRRAGDEKRFDEKMERGCGKRVRGREGGREGGREEEW